MSRDVDLLLAILRASPDGLTRPELLSRLREQFPHIGPADVESALEAGGSATRIANERIYASAPVIAEVGESKLKSSHRFVSFDLESIVRPTTTGPDYREQRVFQIGAVRFGRDEEWVSERSEFMAFTGLRTIEDELLIHSDDVRAKYERHKRPLAEVLEEFRSFCAGAEAIVAYNGVVHDFRLIEEEYERCELRPLLKSPSAPRQVDALYLAQALWPIPPRQHRLMDLLKRLDIDTEEMRWHDALDDSKMVVELLEFGANEFLPTLSDELIFLLTSAGAGSDAWELVFSLADLEPVRRSHDHAASARVVYEALEAKPAKEPLRPEPAEEPDETKEPPEAPEIEPIRVSIPEEIRDEKGRVSIAKLVTAIKGERAEARDSQRLMVESLREWLEKGAPALVEAPTGTGKSLALLAAALDWLAEDDERKVVISTYTKQLQSQLAADIEALTDAVMPELAKAADMVKGSAGRLSLRALILAVSELTEPERPRRRRGRADFSDDQRYRDLVLYLLLRFVAEGKPTEEWESRSVDPVDVPAFFDSYCPRRRSLYLTSLSQSDSSDYAASKGEIGRYTQSVREALESRRLIVANHALLLAHLDDFESIGEKTLLFVDEAHELESAATSALAIEFDSGTIAELQTLSAEWARDQADIAGADELALAAVEFDSYLGSERLERTAMSAFDEAEADPLGRSILRVITIASPLQGDSHVQVMEHLAAELSRAREAIGPISQALRRISRNPPSDPFELDRFQSLRTRAAEIDSGLGKIGDAIDSVFGPSRAPTAQTDEPQSEETEQPAEQLVLTDLGTVDGEPVSEEVVGLNRAEEAEMVESEDAEPSEEGVYSVSRPNRVVFAEEIEPLAPGRERSYRFRVVSAPIELRQEVGWQLFKRRFARSYYVSATLRVANGWDFIRRRLDFPESEVEAIHLGSPFDLGKQAELVCFSDFPSWAEQEDAAMHTVAHQLSGYAAELVDSEGRNGAMVLTTARATSAGIFDWLARLRVERSQTYPLISAGVQGNQPAVSAFKAVGGILVGTRGLWQGVDVDDEERLRIVWINKLPFAPFADPVVAARLALEVEYAQERGIDDPEQYANEHYYLPLAAIALRQAAGRLIRTQGHRGVVVVSDRKLAGPTRLRSLYRQVFLGSLDSGLMRIDPETGEEWGGNVCTMQEGWRRIFSFFAREGLLDSSRAEELQTEENLTAFTELPEMLAISKQELSREEEAQHREAGTLAVELLERSAVIAGQLNSLREPIELKEKQAEAIQAIAEGKDLLAVLPTGYGKSYVFQLPALALPGVTIVVSPLVSLMTDQALELNRTIGGRVRALVAPMRESNSRTGKSEIEEELKGLSSHGIKLVYLSPERLCQVQFQEWIRAGVEKGTVRRIALDEAHTFIQWGDDFRPSLRRAEDFLRRLKQEHPDLQLIALTATANETVREGLRSGIFALEPDEDRDDFAFVLANPLRPELAIYRRVLGQARGGSISLAALVESVVDKLDGHAIFYCLTVRQVEQLYNHLRDYLQGHPVDVLMYHGRCTDAVKTGVANHFKSASKQGEDGYKRMIVVATSAFGLGIDRSDIRAVFCVSPPTDLAALYQQLGRAGRDRAGRQDGEGPFTAALALSYPRAQRTIDFMTAHQAPPELLARAAGKILAQDGVFSARRLAEELVAERLEAHCLGQDEAAKAETFESHETALLRVLAELSLRGIVSDLGDFPKTIEVRPGDCPADTPEKRELVETIEQALPPGHKVETQALYEELRGSFPDDFPNPGSLWHVLLELHTLGHLDVSQRPNREQLTGIEVRTKELPESLVNDLTNRHSRSQLEVARLRDWFASSGVCCNEGLRVYFGAEELPDGTCADDNCRCSSCWNRTGLGEEAEPPALYEAFRTDNLRPSSATAKGRRRSEQNLDGLVLQLLAENYAGLVENIIHSVIRGDDHYYSRAEKKRKLLWPKLLYTRVRGRKPALRQAELHRSIERLLASGQIARIGACRYRLIRYERRDEERAGGQTRLQ